jgi:hypothetical protein
MSTATEVALLALRHGRERNRVHPQRLKLVKAEIVNALADVGEMGYLGLEDRCNEWREPDELRQALAELVLARVVYVRALPLKPTGVYLVYGLAS